VQTRNAALRASPLTLWILLILGGALVSLGLIPLLWWRPLRRNRRMAYPALATVGALCLVAGVILGYASMSTAASPTHLAGPPLSRQEIWQIVHHLRQQFGPVRFS
jgi:hypothetical protein